MAAWRYGLDDLLNPAGWPDYSCAILSDLDARKFILFGARVRFKIDSSIGEAHLFHRVNLSLHIAIWRSTPIKEKRRRQRSQSCESLIFGTIGRLLNSKWS